MSDVQKTVFISYRRNVASFIARAIFLSLREHGYDVFMDVESIDSGDFNQIIFNQIEARAHFLLILTPGTLDNCVNPNDAVRKEIEYALEKQRNIVPLLMSGFSFKEAEQYLPDKLAILPNFNGLNVPHDYFDAAMERLQTRFLKQPTRGMVRPAPASDQPAVQQKIEEVAAQPVPTAEQLSAEEYFNRAYKKEMAGDFDGAIADYTEAIRLNPRLADAHNNRGVARRSKNDFDGAITDYDQAINLRPDFALAYRNRGGAHYHKGNFEQSIGDYTYLVTHHTDDFGIYNNRGEAFFANDQYDRALEDFQNANRLQPIEKITRAGLAITYYALGRIDEAKHIWLRLTVQDQRYSDVEWVGKEFNWRPELIEAARQLIAEL